jgi:UPF0176 protein
MKVVSFYQFTNIADPAAVRDQLQALCDSEGLLGTVLLAEEGVNGTLAGDSASVQAVFDWLRQALKMEAPIEGRWTDAVDAPFRRMRIKKKKEIVTLGRPDIKPHRRTGQHILPEEWNRLIDNPETLIIDTRNHYEFEVGTFQNAIDPGTDSFREFPEFAKELADAGTDRSLAMFCTGGIRCEKATALMMELGFDDVYQLKGGILNYLEQVTDSNNHWNGECFVFDTRVAVDRDLAEGGYVQCHACRRPLSTEDMKSPAYREGVSCPKCIETLGKDRAVRLEERRRQFKLARQRNEVHIGRRLRS